MLRLCPSAQDCPNRQKGSSVPGTKQLGSGFEPGEELAQRLGALTQRLGAERPEPLRSQERLSGDLRSPGPPMVWCRDEHIPLADPVLRRTGMSCPDRQEGCAYPGKSQVVVSGEGRRPDPAQERALADEGTAGGVQGLANRGEGRATSVSSGPAGRAHVPPPSRPSKREKEGLGRPPPRTTRIRGKGIAALPLPMGRDGRAAALCPLRL